MSAGSSQSGTRRTPERSTDFDHLSIGDLRNYRTALAEEENRVSYWRRIIQARLDVVRAGETGAARVDNLRNVLADAHLTSSRRRARHHLADRRRPAAARPCLAVGTGAASRRPAHNELLARDLANAEAQLSAYRNALHRRITGSTDELIARYREDPGLCLLALPADQKEAASRRALAERR